MNTCTTINPAKFLPFHFKKLIDSTWNGSKLKRGSARGSASPDGVSVELTDGSLGVVGVGVADEEVAAVQPGEVHHEAQLVNPSGALKYLNE